MESVIIMAIKANVLIWVVFFMRFLQEKQQDYHMKDINKTKLSPRTRAQSYREYPAEDGSDTP